MNRGGTTQSTPSLQTILTLIESQRLDLTTLNAFCESLPKGTIERSVLRSTRVGRAVPKIAQPEGRCDQAISHKGNSSPTQTHRGRRAVRKRGIANKRHPQRFAEATQFVCERRGQSLGECCAAATKVIDRTALLQLLDRLSRDTSPLAEWSHLLLQRLRP